LVHLPTRASWLNRGEDLLLGLQRKVLTPNYNVNLAVLARALNQFEHHWNEVAEPFEWNSPATTSPS
jgi:hypothetical protein